MPRFDDTKRKAYLEEIRDGAGRAVAAAEVGVNSGTARRHVAEDPEFAAAVSEAEMHRTDRVEHALFKEATGGNVRAMEVWLFNRRPERWSDQRQARIALEMVEAAVEAETVPDLDMEDPTIAARVVAMGAEIEEYLEESAAAAGGRAPRILLADADKTQLRAACRNEGLHISGTNDVLRGRLTQAGIPTVAP